MSPKITEEPIDEDLARIKEKMLLDMLGKKTKPNITTRKLTKAQHMAIRALYKGEMIEIVTRTIDYGEPDPITKQVDALNPKRKGIVATLEVYPEERQWIEHLLKALQGVPLNKRDQAVIMKHMKRLRYEGALRDYYEFYGMSIKELKEKEIKERAKGQIAKADQLRKVIERVEKNG